MILQGDALEELRKLPDKCCSVCVTSPPYYNARSSSHGIPIRSLRLIPPSSICLA